MDSSLSTIEKDMNSVLKSRQSRVCHAGWTPFVIRFLLFLLLSTMISTASSQRLCGRRLTETLSAVCGHRINRPSRDQLRTVRSYQHGVATKCCRNRCSYKELTNYCEDYKK